ncbi:MAG: hypothetical protein ACRDRN_15900 [Sciscionella sp.]
MRPAAGDEPENDPARRRLKQAAASALTAANAGKDATAVEALIDFVVESHDGHGDARDLMLLLFAECSQMVGTLGAGGDTGIKMQVFDSTGQELTIDEADPPVRTAVRTLLAEVHGDADAAAEQVEIALHQAEPAEVASVILQALRWTIRLSDECAERALPTPEWIATALDG